MDSFSHLFLLQELLPLCEKFLGPPLGRDPLYPLPGARLFGVVVERLPVLHQGRVKAARLLEFDPPLGVLRRRGPQRLDQLDAGLDGPGLLAQSLHVKLDRLVVAARLHHLLTVGQGGGVTAGKGQEHPQDQDVECCSESHHGWFPRCIVVLGGGTSGPVNPSRISLFPSREVTRMPSSLTSLTRN